MNRFTGRVISYLDDIKQSIGDILTTPIGTRIMRELYGSFIPELIDAPFNGVTVQRLIAATYDAISRWEPRVILSRVWVDADKDGTVSILLEGKVKADDSFFDHAVPVGRAA